MGSATKRRVTMGRWGSLRCAGSDPVLLTVSSSSSVGIEALELAPLSESQVGVGRGRSLEFVQGVTGRSENFVNFQDSVSSRMVKLAP